MRLAALLPLLCSVASLILAFLCLFAGTKTTFLESYDIVMLNTSRIAVNVFNTTSPSTSSTGSSGDSGGIWGYIQNITNTIKNDTNSIENQIQNDINNGLESLAKTLGLHDFYSLHVLDFCEGFFQPNGTADRNVTHCSNPIALFTFNATNTLQNELDKTGFNISLETLHWPKLLQDGIDAVRLALQVMFVLYVIGIAFTGLSLIGSAAGFVLEGRIIAIINILLPQLAFIALLIASAIITWAATKVTDVVNQYGKDIDVNASRGDGFIALTWVATASMFIASIAWVVELFVHKRKMKKTSKEYQ